MGVSLLMTGQRILFLKETDSSRCIRGQPWETHRDSWTISYSASSSRVQFFILLSGEPWMSRRNKETFTLSPRLHVPNLNFCWNKKFKWQNEGRAVLAVSKGNRILKIRQLEQGALDIRVWKFLFTEFTNVMSVGSRVNSNNRSCLVEWGVSRLFSLKTEFNGA